MTVTFWNELVKLILRLINGALLVAIVAWPAASPAQGVEPSRGSRLDQPVVDPAGKTVGRVDWGAGYIEATGEATANKARALNRAHERALALTAARQLAYFKLAEIIEGVAIDGVTVVKNAMVADQTVRTRVQAHIRGAVVVSENVTEQSDGSVWAVVVVRMPKAGVTEAVGPWVTARPVDRFQPDPSFRVNESYTGLIVEASDAGFSLALAPRLIEEGTGKIIFGPQLVQLAALGQQGFVDYSFAMTEAQRKARVGGNPLIVRAVAAAGDRKGDLVLARKDAERVLAADRDGRFLEKAAVVIVQGKEQRDLATAPGARHAVVVGVDDYPQGVRGAFDPLRYAAADAQAVAAALARTGGFGPGGVTLLVNQQATRDRVLETFRALRARVRDEDTVLIFFSGHGSVGAGADGRLHYYLVPHDGRLDDLARTALEDHRLEELVGELPARRVVVILDACYSGGGTAVIRARGVTNPALKAPVASRPLIDAAAGRIVLSASKPDQLAFEDDQRRAGLFTSFLLEGLTGFTADLNGDGVITVLELYQFVSPRVSEYSRRQYQVEQTPELEVRNLSGDIALARR